MRVAASSCSTAKSWIIPSSSSSCHSTLNNVKRLYCCSTWTVPRQSRCKTTSSLTVVASTLSPSPSWLTLSRRHLANREQRSSDKANKKKKQEKASASKKSDDSVDNLPPSVAATFTALDERIEASLSKLKRDLSELSIASINPAMFDDIQIELSSKQPSESLLSLANIASQTSHSIALTLFDAAHEKAILKSLQGVKLPGMGALSPSSERVNDTVQITISLPKVGKDGREEMRKDVHRRCEDSKSVVRTHRAWAMTALKRESLTDDESTTVKNTIQRKIDRGVDIVSTLEKEKDKELASA